MKKLKLKLRRLISMWGKLSVVMYLIMCHPMMFGMHGNKIGALVCGMILAIPVSMFVQSVRWIYSEEP